MSFLSLGNGCGRSRRSWKTGSVVVVLALACILTPVQSVSSTVSESAGHAPLHVAGDSSVPGRGSRPGFSAIEDLAAQIATWRAFRRSLPIVDGNASGCLLASLTQMSAEAEQDTPQDASHMYQGTSQASEAGSVPRPSRQESAARSPFATIFGTVSFKRPMELFKLWQGVMRRNVGDAVIFRNGRIYRKGTSWQAFRTKAAALSGRSLLRYVNEFWNAYPYREDIRNWGQQDYWEIPEEFLRKSGDCEDYAVIKYYTLRQLGYSADHMRIVVVKDTVRGLIHAVLAVLDGGDVLILDNISNAMLPHGRLVQYVPQYSVNEKHAWVHFKARKAK